MKKFLLLSAFFVFSSSLFSQENIYLIPYRSGKLWGYSDTLGNIKIKPQFDSVSFFYNSNQVVISKNKKGVVNRLGKLIIPVDFDEVEEYVDGFAAKRKNIYGFYDFQGRRVLSVKYESISRKDSLFIVREGKKYKIFNFNGKPFSKFSYDTINTQTGKDETLLAKVKNQHYLIQIKTGLHTPVTEKQADEMLNSGEMYGPPMLEATTGAYNPGQAKIQKELYWREKLDATRLSLLSTYPDTYLVTKGNQKSIIEVDYRDSLTYIMPSFNYDSITLISNITNNQYGYVIVATKGNKYGIINEKNQILYPFELDNARRIGYSAGVYELTKGKLAGVYNTYSVYPSIKPKYQAVETSFSGGPNFVVYKVWVNGRYGYVGENGVEFFDKN